MQLLPKILIQVLCELAGVVLDEDMEYLLEPRHLLKHPKYK